MRAAPNPVQQPLWRLMTSAARPMTSEELAAAIRVTRQAVHVRLLFWRRAGLVERIMGRPMRYALKPEAIASAANTNTPPQVGKQGRLKPRRRTQTERLWRFMRIVKRFDRPTLLLGCEGVGRRTTDEFLLALFRAGYLTREGTGQIARYRLVRDTGPKPPRITRSDRDGVTRRWLVDGNTGKQVELIASHTRPSRRRPQNRGEG